MIYNIESKAFNSSESFTGTEIEHWCRKNCFTIRDAFRVLYDYWISKHSYALGKNVYYFIETGEMDDLGKSWKLKRDLDKSPKLDNEKGD